MSQPIDKALLKDCLVEAISDVIEAKKHPLACSQCQKPLVGKDERERGICSTCEVASWSPEKKKAIGRLVALGVRRSFKGEPVPDADIDAAIDEAFKHEK